MCGFWVGGVGGGGVLGNLISFMTFIVNRHRNRSEKLPLTNCSAAISDIYIHNHIHSDMLTLILFSAGVSTHFATFKRTLNIITYFRLFRGA